MTDLALFTAALLDCANPAAFYLKDRVTPGPCLLPAGVAA
jgi:hypothetical protein